MKALLPLFLTAVLLVSCGREEEIQKIEPGRADTEFRKPAQPVEIEYPMYPRTAEMGPDPDQFPETQESRSILEGVFDSVVNDPENAAAIEGAIATAMEQAPAILEAFTKQTGDGSTGATAESYAPILEEILGENGEISQEAIDQVSGMIAEHAPAIIEGVLSQSTSDEEPSIGSAIAGMIFRKLFESDSESR